MGKVDKSRMKRSKHKDRKVGDFGSVQARNEQKWLEKKDDEDEDEESGSEEEEDEKEKDPNVYVKEKAVNSVMAQVAAMRINEGEEGVVEKAQPTRREKEAMQKEAARKRYEKMHAEGKTDEAKADLARLAEIKAKREAQRVEREEADAKAKAAREAANLREEYVKNLGGETAGKRKKDKKDKKEKKDKKKDNSDSDSGDDNFVNPYAFNDIKNDKKEKAPAASDPYAKVGGDSSDKPKQCQRHNEGLYEAVTAGLAKPEKEDPSTFTQGSIEACRAEEDDFM